MSLTITTHTPTAPIIDVLSDWMLLDSLGAILTVRQVASIVEFFVECGKTSAAVHLVEAWANGEDEGEAQMRLNADETTLTASNSSDFLTITLHDPEGIVQHFFHDDTADKLRLERDDS